MKPALGNCITLAMVGMVQVADMAKSKPSFMKGLSPCKSRKTLRVSDIKVTLSKCEQVFRLTTSEFNVTVLARFEVIMSRSHSESIEGRSNQIIQLNSLFRE